jgi:hypothetical protein
MNFTKEEIIESVKSLKIKRPQFMKKSGRFMRCYVKIALGS